MRNGEEEALGLLAFAHTRACSQVNNASSQFPKESLEDITDEQLELTFRTNIFAMFYMARYVRPTVLFCVATGSSFSPKVLLFS
jgi:NAD(P)-dependent dehydrogenase (short-subunit alcohol dehydrogenase family)